MKTPGLFVLLIAALMLTACDTTPTQLDTDSSEYNELDGQIASSSSSTCTNLPTGFQAATGELLIKTCEGSVVKGGIKVSTEELISNSTRSYYSLDPSVCIDHGFNWQAGYNNNPGCSAFFNQNTNYLKALKTYLVYTENGNGSSDCSEGSCRQILVRYLPSGDPDLMAKVVDNKFADVKTESGNRAIVDYVPKKANLKVCHGTVNSVSGNSLNVTVEHGEGICNFAGFSACTIDSSPFIALAGNKPSAGQKIKMVIAKTQLSPCKADLYDWNTDYVNCPSCGNTP